MERNSSQARLLQNVAVCSQLQLNSLVAACQRPCTLPQLRLQTASDSALL
jgi:hypothetical protein